MFADDIRRALPGTQRERLADLSAVVWKGYSAGAISAEDAQQLAEEIEAHKVLASQRSSVVTLQRRQTGSRPRSPALVERRRMWSASGWLPPLLASRFTQGEQAALGVVLAEIALTGRCELCHGAVAGRAGVSVSTVKRAMGEARRLGLVLVEVRRVSRFRNDSNVVTVLSTELKTWVATRGRGLRAARGMWGEGGGVQIGATPKFIDSSSASKASRMSRNRAGREDWNVGSALPEPRTPPRTKSTLGAMGAPYSGFCDRHVGR